MTYRILITGSRKWTSAKTIRNALIDVRASLNSTGKDGLDVVLVSGHCPDGADKMCEDVAESIGWKIERHPAEWSKYGKRAGFLRNEKMVELGADMCIAFIKDKSKGASYTAALAEKAGIHTWRFESEST